MRLVLIDWVDSRQPESGWRKLSEGDYQKPCECRTAGFLVYDGDDFKVIAPTMANMNDSEGVQGCGLMTIPAASVKNVAELVAKPGHEATVTSSASC